MLFPRIVLLMAAVILAGCSGSGWMVDDARVHGVTFHLEKTSEDRFNFDERRLNKELRSELVGSVADSLSLSALDRIKSAYNESGRADFSLTDDPDEADIIFRIDEVRIRGVRTLNVVHPGPVFRISATISGYRGERKVFEQKHTLHNNLAVVASDGGRFYIPSAEEREDLSLQQLTIYPVLRSVFGQIWQDVIDHDRKMR